MVLTLVERGGSARSFHVDGTSVAELIPIIRANLSAKRRDDRKAPSTKLLNRRGSATTRVDHGKHEYVAATVHTNTVEGYYSIFKRGMKGVYQHCGEKHLHRYLAEFDFRYSNRVRLASRIRIGLEKRLRASLASD